MFYSDGAAVYSYGIVHGLNKASTVLDGLSNVNSMVVDQNRGFLFLGSPSKVDRYDLLVDVSSTVPTISVNRTSQLEVYTTNNQISTMTIDADQKVLYVSELDQITAVYYKDFKEGDDQETKTLYEDIENVVSMAPDYAGNLYWGLSEGGLTDGAIVRGKADSPNPDTT